MKTERVADQGLPGDDSVGSTRPRRSSPLPMSRMELQLEILEAVDRAGMSPGFAMRLATKVTLSGAGCWTWVGSRTPNGYGRIQADGCGEVLLAHRVMYELFTGPVPQGADVDHLCRNEPCCNPAHLEAVSHQVNCLRGEHPWMVIHRSGRCKRGHDRSVYGYYRPSGALAYCRECVRERRARTA